MEPYESICVSCHSPMGTSLKCLECTAFRVSQSILKDASQKSSGELSPEQVSQLENQLMDILSLLSGKTCIRTAVVTEVTDCAPDDDDIDSYMNAVVIARPEYHKNVDRVAGLGLFQFALDKFRRPS